eukprot:m.1387159 g.1387159  ORF g.1387159 m.1387159 type:complete len:886 (+) comp24980_c0_seq3:424-3081(+)
MWSSTPSDHGTPPSSRVPTRNSSIVDTDGRSSAGLRMSVSEHAAHDIVASSVSGGDSSNLRALSSTSSDGHGAHQRSENSSHVEGGPPPAGVDRGPDEGSGQNCTAALDNAADFLFFDQSPMPLVAGEDSAASVPACILRVSEIAASCADQGVPWRDTDFDVLGDTVQMPVSAPPGITWVKACDLYHGRGELFFRDEPAAPVQIGCCNSHALFGAASMLSEEALHWLMIAYDSFANVYGVRMFVNGRWQYVIVDGYIGCAQDDTGEEMPVFSRSTRRGELWPVILEKAYRKLKGGYRYNTDETVADALEMLTGGMLVSRTMDTYADRTAVLRSLRQALVPSTVIGCSASAAAPCMVSLESDDRRCTYGITTAVVLKIEDDNASHWPSAEGASGVSDPLLHVRVGTISATHSRTSDGTPLLGPESRGTIVTMSLSNFLKAWSQLTFYKVLPTEWSLSTAVGAFTSAETVPLYTITPHEDMHCCVNITPWTPWAGGVNRDSTSTDEHPHRVAPNVSIGFYLASMPRVTWDTYGGSRADLIDEIYASAERHGGGRSGASAYNSGAWLTVVADRTYFIVPFFTKRHSLRRQASDETAGTAFVLRVAANKFCLRVQSHEENDPRLSQAIKEFGVYIPVNDGQSLEDALAEVDSATSMERTLERRIERVQSIRIVVPSKPMAELMGTCPRMRVRFCRIHRLPTEESLGIKLFSPKNEPGVRVAKIKPGSPVRRTTNLHELDVILEVNGVATFSSNKNQRVWTTHQDVVELLVRAGNNFTLLVCSEEDFKMIPQVANDTLPRSLVAIEENGYVKLMPAAGPTDDVGRLGFQPSQLSSVGQYRDTAAQLHALWRAQQLSRMEYRACLKIALASALSATLAAPPDDDTAHVGEQ